jgi:NAD dependent epimerase/dehydratase family enzyme
VSWVALADAVGLYRFALESETIRGPLNVTAPDPRPQVVYARALAAAFHRPSLFWTPGWIVRLLLRDQATLALGSRRIWPAKALAAGYVFERPCLEVALEAALGTRSTEGRTRKRIRHQ